MKLGMTSIEFEILGKAYRILAEFPLCDNCLGRLFAGYGRGLSNRDRGRAIKTLLLMKFHGEVGRGGLSEDKKGEVIRVLNNMGSISETVLREVFGVEPEFKPCYICGRDLEVFLDSLTRKVVDYLKELGLRIRSFVVGCRVARDIIEREENLCFVHSIGGSESIKSEVKRELGKRVMKLTGLRVDFDRPDVVVLVSGDGDFRDLIEYLKSLGCYTEVMAFKRTASSQLIGVADTFTDLAASKFLIR